MSRPPPTGWTCASWKPGTSILPEEVDDLGRRADVCPDVIVGADADDAPAANRAARAHEQAASTV